MIDEAIILVGGVVGKEGLILPFPRTFRSDGRGGLYRLTPRRKGASYEDYAAHRKVVAILSVENTRS